MEAQATAAQPVAPAPLLPPGEAMAMLARRGFRPCIERDLWALTPHVYAVSAKSDLVANVCRVVAEGLLALGPPAH